MIRQMVEGEKASSLCMRDKNAPLAPKQKRLRMTTPKILNG
jgi:hypothetical protein